MQPKIKGLVKYFVGGLTRDRQLLPIKNADEILAVNRKSIDSIWQLAGFDDGLFEDLYQFPISRVAEVVQSFPCSDTGHHAWPGGLITHILETCVYALRLRKGVYLPAGATPEVRARKVDLYTYAVFAASLLNEVGAVQHTMKIRLYDRRRRYLCEWHPILEDIGSHPKAKYLKIEFRQDHESRCRGMPSLMYATRILPPSGLIWLMSDPEVFDEFLRSFSITPTGPIHQLVVKGKQASVEKEIDSMGTPHTVTERSKRSNVREASRRVRGEPGTRQRKAAKQKGSNDDKKVVGRKSASQAKGPEKPNAISGNRKQEKSEIPESGEETRIGPGEKFRAWLEAGINESLLSVNEDRAPVHMTDQGLFLVIPTIFEMHAAERSASREAVQREFKSLGIHLKSTGNEDQDWWQARVQRDGKISMIKGWLVPTEHFVLRVELELNEGLRLLTRKTLLK